VDGCGQVGISEQPFYMWKRKYAGHAPSELRELRQLRDENVKLKRLVAARLLGTCCRRSAGKSCMASGPARVGALGANDRLGQWASGLEVVADGAGRLAVSESSRSSGGIADALSGVGRHTSPLRLPTTHGVVATGRLARECQANGSVVHGGRSDGEDEEASESGSAAPGPTGCGDRADPAVEYGFHERARFALPLRRPTPTTRRPIPQVSLDLHSRGGSHVPAYLLTSRATRATTHCCTI
jgi:hypothetical protein